MLLQYNATNSSITGIEPKKFVSQVYGEEPLDEVLEEHLANTPKDVMSDVLAETFIPRDSGFFSVFNMLMGSICTGRRLYPYYNKSVIPSPKHFAYLEDDDIKSNEWFKYFKSIKYTKDDDSHTDGDCMKFPRAHDVECGSEFSSFKVYKKMMQDNHIFTTWRHKIHNVYKKYICLNDDVQRSIDTFWSQYVKHGDKVIAVHYRHPSHYCEAGEVYFHQYDQHLRSILDDYPDAKIFVASDNDLCIMMMKAKYGEKVFYWPDVGRVGIDNILEWIFAKTAKGAVVDDMDFINGKGYQMHYVACETGKGGSHMAIEVIRDVFCMARCDWFIHMTSNLALAASYINPKVKMLMV